MRLEEMPTVRFLGEECTIDIARYGGGMPSISLTCSDGEPMAKATVNIPDAWTREEPPIVFIKNYSENDGIMEVLQHAGIIGPSLWKVPIGFVAADACKLLVEVD